MVARGPVLYVVALSVCRLATQTPTPEPADAWLGYGWVGCSSEERPRPAEWDVDYGGKALDVCKETSAGSGVFERHYPKATVQWDCNAAQGKQGSIKPAS